MTHYDDAKETFRCEHGKVRGHACRFCAEGAPLLRDGRHFVDGSTVECELSKEASPSDPSADAQRIGEMKARSQAGLPPLDVDYDWLIQRVAQAEQELSKWKTCSLCGEVLTAPGHCDAAESERVKGLEQMHEETLDRAEQAESALAAARQEVERHRSLCLAELGGPDVWPCGCHERILDSHGTRQLLTAADGEIHQECDAHSALRADLAAARLRGTQKNDDDTR